MPRSSQATRETSSSSEVRCWIASAIGLSSRASADERVVRSAQGRKARQVLGPFRRRRLRKAIGVPFGRELSERALHIAGRSARGQTKRTVG